MRLFLIVSFSLLSLYSLYSQNAKSRENLNSDSRFEAIVDNCKWEGETSIYLDAENYRCFYFYPDNLDDHITIRTKCLAIGDYKLSDSSVVLLRTIRGDVLNGIYYSSGNTEDKLVISKVDYKNGFVEGSFYCKLKLGDNVIDINSASFKSYFIKQ